MSPYQTCLISFSYPKCNLNPYPCPEFLGPSPSAFSEKKNPESSLVTSQLGLRKRKLYVQKECELGYLMMPIPNGICQYVRKYAALNKNICHFLGQSPSALSRKKFQSIGTQTNDAMLCSGFFPRNALGDGPAFWISFPGFTDKG